MSFYPTRGLSQQPALGALTFLRSFVAGKVNFCSHLLACLVHFTVVKSQTIFIAQIGFSLAFDWSWKTLIRKGWILMFFGFFLFINSSARYTSVIQTHRFVVKATIDGKSPHAKLLCLNISNEVEVSSF